MANTTLYNNLQARLSELRINLLPEEFDDLGNYDNKELDMVKGYMLLVHSEIEYYFESICHKFVDLQVNEFRTSYEPNLCTMALLAYSKLEWDISLEQTTLPSIQSSSLSQTLKTIITKMAKEYNAIINGNHGVKEKNLLKLIAPTGTLDSFPVDELANFDTLGSERGRLAHISGRHIGIQIDPKTQLSNLNNNILPSLKEFDKRLVDIEDKLLEAEWNAIKPGSLPAI
ncbi:hypothetical protein [Pseudoalteromonas rhizosphaerae]|uniref:hypothetical protein n=1 Tax=Pseudoalteromonas rhizosphaerae TaxID=2518973 RepID=UPI00237F2472|nr:hypothetical protein [Pseudoalteromonas rhizosphaerae]